MSMFLPEKTFSWKIETWEFISTQTSKGWGASKLFGLNISQKKKNFELLTQAVLAPYMKTFLWHLVDKGEIKKRPRHISLDYDIAKENK